MKGRENKTAETFIIAAFTVIKKPPKKGGIVPGTGIHLSILINFNTTQIRGKSQC